MYVWYSKVHVFLSIRRIMMQSQNISMGEICLHKWFREWYEQSESHWLLVVKSSDNKIEKKRFRCWGDMLLIVFSKLIKFLLMNIFCHWKIHWKIVQLTNSLFINVFQSKYWTFIWKPLFYAVRMIIYSSWNQLKYFCCSQLYTNHKD